VHSSRPCADSCAEMPATSIASVGPFLCIRVSLVKLAAEMQTTGRLVHCLGGRVVFSGMQSWLGSFLGFFPCHVPKDNVWSWWRVLPGTASLTTPECMRGLMFAASCLQA
jgi:hypothetical protein